MIEICPSVWNTDICKAAVWRLEENNDDDDDDDDNDDDDDDDEDNNDDDDDDDDDQPSNVQVEGICFFQPIHINIITEDEAGTGVVKGRGSEPWWISRISRKLGVAKI